MRVGQKNKITYRWARTGSRPRADHDQRTQSAYLFGAVCPERGTGAALVLPACNTQAMQLHLDEIATEVAPGAHAILILKPDGMVQKTSGFQAISRSCRWRRARPNSIPKKTSGSSCVKIGCRTASLNPSTTFSITAATLGGRSSINPGKSCLSLAAIGQPTVSQSEDWYELVLQQGAVIDARVLAVRDNLARILIAGLAVEVLTEAVLQPGAD